MIILRGERARQVHARLQSPTPFSPRPAAARTEPSDPPLPSGPSTRDDDQRVRSEDERSLDLVQRLIISTLLAVIFGAPTAALTLYAPVLAETDRTSGTGLWVMCGIVGLMGVAAVRVVHRRSPWSIWLLTGLIPAAASRIFLF